MKNVSLLILFSFLLSNIFFAQDTLSKKQLRKQKASFLIPNKTWTIEVPVWIPGFSGSFAQGDVEIEGEDGVNPEHPIEPPPGGEFGKIISRLFQKNWYLKFFFIGKLVYEKDKFLIQMDALSGSVGNSVKFIENNNEIVHANFTTTNIRLFGGYKLFETLTKNGKFKFELFGYFGTRVHFHSVSSDLIGTTNKLSFTPYWWEPIVGIQSQFTLKRWFFVVQGDYGGVFIKDKYSEQLSFFTLYRTGKMLSVKLGWNHLQLNHSGTFSNEEYKVKAILSGPCVGLAFHF